MKDKKSKNHISISELIESGLLPGKNSMASVRAMIARRQIPYRKLGGRVYFLRDEIIEWLREQPGNPLQGRRKRANAELKHLSEIIENFDSNGIDGLKAAIEELSLTIELQNI